MARATVTVNIADLPQVKALMTAARERIKALEAALWAVEQLADEHENRWPEFTAQGDVIPASVSVADLRAALTAARPSVPPSSRAVTEDGK